MEASSLDTCKLSENLQSRYLLNFVVREYSSVYLMITLQNQSLLVRWDSLLVLDFGLDVLDGVGWLDIKGDGLSCKGFDEDLHWSLVLCVFVLNLFL